LSQYFQIQPEPRDTEETSSHPQTSQTWNLKLNTSERYLSTTTDEEEDRLQLEDADSSEADEPEDSMMYYEGEADD
jgi:hypothetical protein